MKESPASVLVADDGRLVKVYDDGGLSQVAVADIEARQLLVEVLKELRAIKLAVAKMADLEVGDVFDR